MKKNDQQKEKILLENKTGEMAEEFCKGGFPILNKIVTACVLDNVAFVKCYL